MKICDMHTHSDNSFDAKSSVDEMCLAAIERGLYALAITDHCEAPFIRFGHDCEFGCFDELIPKSFADATAARWSSASPCTTLSRPKKRLPTPILILSSPLSTT